MTLEDRINALNKHFGFIENPDDFNFSLSPERIAYRNEALRKNNRELYTSYLINHFPNEMEQELQLFDEKISSISKISKDKALAYFNQNGINLLQSDIFYQELDAIFSMFKVRDEDLSWYLKDNTTDLLGTFVTPEQAFEAGKTEIYLDKSKITSKI